MGGFIAWVGLARAADVDLFDVAASFASGAGTPQGEAPRLGVPGFAGGVVGVWTHAPVVRSFGGRAPELVVADLVPVWVQAGWTFGRAVRLDVLFPTYVWVDAPLTGYRGPAPGDLRVQATVPLVQGAVSLALVPRLGLGTGESDAVVARGTWHSWTLALGQQGRAGGWVADLGLVFAQDRPLEPGGPSLGSTAEGQAGAWLGDRLRVGAEVDLDLRFADDGAANRASSAHGFVQGLLPGGLGLAAGAGTGLLAGIGSPEVRVFGAVTWRSVLRDADGDGFLDRVDPCPSEAEDVDGFDDDDGCPELDNDGDTLTDAVDTCPDEAEDRDGFEDVDGCPDPDDDGDTIPDPDDRCPYEPGPAERAGCPDTDGDGIADTDDRCEHDAGPAPDGCPAEASVPVPADGLRIAEHITFASGRAALEARSLHRLDVIAKTLRAQPEIRIEVQGHTDDAGPAEANLALSQARAEAVVAYLVMRGIAPERLVAKGYGEQVPVTTNRTAGGRDANRRVMFVPLE
jgi:outer membrane protein OmpA-like peptidoglycan-associated protein